MTSFGQYEEFVMHPNLSRQTFLSSGAGGSLAAALANTTRAQEATPNAPASATPGISGLAALAMVGMWRWG